MVRLTTKADHLDPVHNSPATYIRVGTVYYKIAQRPRAYGEPDEVLLPWNGATIVADHGKEYLMATIPKYDGFCLQPNHQNFQREIGGFYNAYHPLPYEPKDGSWYITRLFLEHIFAEHFEYGLDYLKALYEKPTQILPILCLVSRERGTGKTTFLNWIKQIFGKNATINSNTDFRSRFSSEWVSKLLICVDETLLDKKEDAELLKTLATARFFKNEAKGANRYETEFYGKFILCSNHPSSFIYIEPQEIRFWVREIPPFSGELLRHIKELREALHTEIPAFLYALTQRAYSTSCQSRMWFKPSQIETAALRRLKANAKPKLVRDLEDALAVVFEQTEQMELFYTVADLLQLLKTNNTPATHSDLKQLLTKTWNLAPSPNSNSYTVYMLNAKGEWRATAAKGRYYRIAQKLTQNDDFDE